MQLRTEGLLRQTDDVAKDESSINYAERQFDDEMTAESFFNELKEKLGDISHWNHKSGLSSYELFDEGGDFSSGKCIKRGAFIKITLHGSGKNDWVRVEDICDFGREMIITLRPTYDPTGDPPQTGRISHFFSAEAINNICAFRQDRSVFLYVIGLNEKLNSGRSSGIIETARNALVANVGYYLGIQKAEWTKFCNSFLFDDQDLSAK